MCAAIRPGSISRHVIVALALGLGPLAFMVGAQNPAGPQFRAGVDIFQLEVTVLDRDRRLVRGLTAADFVVREEGKPQTIVGFSEVAFPERDGPITVAQEETAPDVVMPRYADRRLFAIIMNDWDMPATAKETPMWWPTPEAMVADTKTVAKKIIDALGPSDFACVILTRDTRFFPDFSSDRWKLLSAVDQFRPVAADSAERIYLQMVTRGHIGGLPALQDIVESLAKLPQHSKTVIYITAERGATFNVAGPTGSRVLDIIRTAQSSGIRISSVDPKGLIVAKPSDLLQTLAENTGGSAITHRNDFIQAVPQFFEETQSYYLIGYQRAGPSDGRFRKVDVHVSRPGLTTIARTGYVAPGKADMVKAPSMSVDEALDTAVDALGRASGHRLSTYAVMRPRMVRAVAEISGGEFAAAKWSHGADVEASVTRGSGDVVASARGQIPQGERSVELDIPLKDSKGQTVDPSLGPFHVSIKVSAGDESLEDGADAGADGTLLGEPIVFRAATPVRAPLRPVAEFLFSRTERLRVEFPVLTPAPDRRARLLRRNGEALSVVPQLSERTVDGQTITSTDLSLSFLAAGDYAIELLVQNGEGQAERKLVAFRVQ